MNGYIEEIIIKNYVDKKRGQAYTAKMAGISINELKKYLKGKNIPIRDHNQATIAANQNKTYRKNEGFFKTQSADMAWILGFLASNGSIGKKRNTIKIGVAKKDREILEKIQKTIGVENKIVDYTNSRGFDCAEISWTSAEHKKDLAKYFITPQKTFTLKPPYELEKQFWIDYIRGYFDGDGSVNLISTTNGRGSGSLRWQICSATKEILSFILTFFESEYNIPKVQIQVRPGINPLYYIQYSSVATRTIYQHLYTPEALCLSRKKEHFEYIISQINSKKVI